MTLRRVVPYVGLLLVLVVLWLYGRAGLSLWVQQLARRELDRGAIAAAQGWLDWAGRVDANNGTTDLMQAFCFRQRQQTDRWTAALKAASGKGVNPSLLQQEAQLQLAREGSLNDAAIAQLMDTAATSLTTFDIPASLVHGYLANRQYDLAARLLDAWNADLPSNPHLLYMTGLYWKAKGDTVRARQVMQVAQSAEPRHELVAIALAESFEKEDQQRPALDQYVELLAAAPGTHAATIGIARIVRRLGYADRAQQVLSDLVSQSSPPSEAVVEMGRIATERGDYEQAVHWFRQSDSDDTENMDFLAIALALAGDHRAAEPYFASATKARNQIVRSYDLRTRLSLDRNDSVAAQELQGLLLSPVPAPEMQEDSTLPRSDSGTDLYLAHCAACHGETGAGDGRGARHLYPPPRNLRSEPSRLASTVNGVPTLEDSIAVLRRGIPGTAMGSFRHLSEEDLTKLAGEIRRLRRAGLRDQFAREQASQGETTEASVIRRFVDARTTPAEAVSVPVIGSPGSETLQRGKELYHRQGCISCHGADGGGANGSTWYDAMQRPLRPRDLARERLKGGGDPAAIYLRIVVGMPGTPHPASPTLTEQEALDLALYCHSLSRDPKSSRTNYERAALATSEAYLKFQDALAE
jgi:cytochrome c